MPKTNIDPGPTPEEAAEAQAVISKRTELVELERDVVLALQAHRISDEELNTDSRYDYLRGRLEQRWNGHRPKVRKLEKLLETTRDELEDIIVKVPAAGEVIAAEKSRKAAEVAAELQPAHRAAVQEIAKALEALSAAVVREVEIRAELTRRTGEICNSRLPILLFPGVGALDDFSSPAAAWFRMAERHGLLNRKGKG